MKIGLVSDCLAGRSFEELLKTCKELGIEQVEPEKIMEVARLACADTDTLHNMPFEVNADMVYAAIMGADAMGKAYKDE